MTSTDETGRLDRALAIALDAHRGTSGKGGEPGILHPLRVMLRCAAADERLVAVLHDVVEGSSWTLGALREAGFDERIVEAVDALSRRHGEDYDDYIGRAAAVPLARRVKILDLEDNARRVRELIEEAGGTGRRATGTGLLQQKLARYARALDRLRRG